MHNGEQTAGANFSSINFTCKKENT